MHFPGKNLFVTQKFEAFNLPKHFFLILNFTFDNQHKYYRLYGKC